MTNSRRFHITFSAEEIAQAVRDSATASGMVPSAYIEKWMTYALRGPHALDIAFRQRLAEVEIDCKKLKAERDEADRRAGAAERLLADTSDTLSKMQNAMRTRKRDAGYSEVTSFDVIWAEVLEKARMVDRLRNDTKHHHHLTPLQPVTGEEQWRFGSIYNRADLLGELSHGAGHGQWRTLHAPGHSGFALVVWRGADDEGRTPEYEERARAMLDTLNWVEARPKATVDAGPEQQVTPSGRDPESLIPRAYAGKMKPVWMNGFWSNAPAQRHPADLGLQKIPPQWIHVHKDYIVFSRSDWLYPDSVEGDAGQRDAMRYATIDRMDGDIVLHLNPEAYKDNEHLATMIQSLWGPKK